MTAVTYRFVNNAPHDLLASAHVRPFALIVAAVVLVGGAWVRAQRIAPLKDRIVGIRVYTLKPGVRNGFHRRFIQESLPLLHGAHVDVVAYGPSLHDDPSCS